LPAYLFGTKFYTCSRTKFDAVALASPRFTAAALRQFAEETWCKIDDIGEVIEVMRDRNAVLAYELYIRRTNSLLLDHFADAYLHEKMKAATRRRSRSSMDSLLDSIDRPILFHGWIAGLNLIEPAENAQLAALIAEYKAYMDTVVEPRVLRWASSHAHIAKPLFGLATKLRRAFLLKYGSRLRALIDTVAALSVFDKQIREGPDSEWQAMFEFVWQQLDYGEALRSLVVWNTSLRKGSTTPDGQPMWDRDWHLKLMTGVLAMVADRQSLQRALLGV
jgi:hypothetical protein